jgi:hypothetical protein
MFCPNCKLEYREGFTECSDCQVPLVRNLAEARASNAESQDSEAVELLWTGTDSNASSAIANALDAAKISYHTTTREVGPLPGLSMPVFAILIHARDAAIARTALEEARRKSESSDLDADDGGDPDALALPDAMQHDDEGDSSQLPPDYVPEDFDTADATTEVWSGADVTAQNLKLSLRETGIGCAITEVNAVSHLAVLPSDEARAREIIREVVEASAPE